VRVSLPRPLVLADSSILRADAQWIIDDADRTREGYLRYLCTNTRSTSMAPVVVGEWSLSTIGGYVLSFLLPLDRLSKSSMLMWCFCSGELDPASDGAADFFRRFAAAQIWAAEQGACVLISLVVSLSRTRSAVVLVSALRELTRGLCAADKSSGRGRTSSALRSGATRCVSLCLVLLVVQASPSAQARSAHSRRPVPAGSRRRGLHTRGPVDARRARLRCIHFGVSLSCESTGGSERESEGARARAKARAEARARARTRAEVNPVLEERVLLDALTSRDALKPASRLLPLLHCMILFLQLALVERSVRGSLGAARLGATLEQAARDVHRGLYRPGESTTAS